MSENEIKPVAWRCIWSKSGKPAWEQYHDESDPMPEQWDVRPNEVRPLYDLSAIDRLIARARGFRAIANEAAGMLEDAEDRIDRLTAERDELRADAERYRWLRRLEGECDSAACVNFNIGFDWIEAHGVELDAAIDAARAKEVE